MNRGGGWGGGGNEQDKKYNIYFVHSFLAGTKVNLHVTLSPFSFFNTPQKKKNNLEINKESMCVNDFHIFQKLFPGF
jgi:hypothetical protein